MTAMKEDQERPSWADEILSRLDRNEAATARTALAQHRMETEFRVQNTRLNALEILTREHDQRLALLEEPCSEDKKRECLRDFCSEGKEACFASH